jgi:predicted ATPase
MAKLFADPQCRLLTGMGGIGKTRLTIEFGSRYRDLLPDGVRYVPRAFLNSETRAEQGLENVK